MKARTLSVIIIIALTANGMAQNVGIGIDDPESALHVLGDIRCDSLSIKSGSSQEAVFFMETGSKMLEQNYFNSYTGASIEGWQSFSATADGKALHVCLRFYLNSAISQVKLYAGNGISGDELQSMDVSIEGTGMLSLPPFSVDIDSGSVYTVWVNNITGITMATTNPYPGGSCSYDSSWDFVFRLFISEDIPFMVHGTGKNVLTMRDNSNLEVDGNISSNEVHVTSRIGIGTVVPDYPLTIQNVGFNSNIVGIKNFNGELKWRWDLMSHEDLRFASATSANAFVMKQNGNIGSGTSFPQARIHVLRNESNGGTNDFLLLQNAGSGGVGFKLQRSGSFAWQCYLENDGSFRLGQFSVADYLRINQSGDAGFISFLGIGTFDPGYRLDIQAPGVNTTIASFKSTGGRSDILIQNGVQRMNVGVNETGGFINTNSPQHLQFQTGSTNRIFIHGNSGNVGVGTSNPASRLHVNTGAANSVTAYFQSEGGFGEVHAGNGTHTINFGSNAAGCYLGTYSDSDLRIRTNNNIRMLIRQSDGNVGIGTEFPLAKLDVNGDVVIAGSIINDAMQLPVLQNNWVDYNAGFEQAGYFRDKFRIVHLKGLVCLGSSAVIMTLPEGYRPAGQLLFTVVSGNGFARIDVLQNGEVKLIGTYDNAYVSLTGISFRLP